MTSMSAFKDKTLMITGGTGSFGSTVLKHFFGIWNRGNSDFQSRREEAG